MSSWAVDLNFNHETVRLDRKGTAAFRTETLLRLVKENDKENQSDEQTAATFFAHASPKGVCVVSDNQMQLLDAKCSAHLATVNFDCHPEIAVWSADGSFIIVGDALGTVHFLDVQSRAIVFSQQIKAPNTQGARVFVGITFLGEKQTDMAVVMTDHTIFHFRNVDLVLLRQALATRNTQQAIQIKKQIAVAKIDVVGMKEIRHMSVVTDTTGSSLLYLAGSGDQSLAVWAPTAAGTSVPLAIVDSLQVSSVCLPLVKVVPGLDGRTLLTLTPNGVLQLWDRHRLLLMRSWPKRVVIDFELLQERSEEQISDVNIESAEKGLLVTLTKQENITLLELFRWPSFDRIFSQEVSHNTSLIRTAPHQGLCFLEASQHTDDSEDSLREIFLRVLSEAVPMQRFQHLLNKKQYGPAEELARKHRLDVQLVYKARVSALVVHSSESPLPQETINEVLSAIPSITDDSFVLDVCIHAAASSLTQTRSLLDAALSLVRRLSGQRSATTATPVAVLGVHRSLRRLGTYQLIWSSLANAASVATITNEIPTGMLWQSFREADLVQEMRDLLSRGHVTSAAQIWNRHHNDDARLVSDLPDILRSLPLKVPVSLYVPWLTDEVLPHIQSVQDSLRLWSWIEGRARAVESYEHKPHSALLVVSLLDSTFTLDVVRPSSRAKFFAPASPASLVDRFVDPNDSLASEAAIICAVIGALKSQLQDLVYLWDSFNLHLSLAEYTQLHIATIAFRLLDRVTTAECLSETIDREFKPYLLRHDLTVDSLLLEYCMETMDDTGQSSHLADALWEARVLAVIPSISSIDIRMEATLELMRRTPVPWSDAMQAMIDEALLWKSRSRSEELCEQYRLMNLKKMLLRYNVKVVNIGNASLAKSLVRHIVANPNEASAMEDALQVVNAFNHLNRFDAFTLRSYYLCRWNRKQDVVALLESLDSKEAAYVSTEVMMWLQEQSETEATEEDVCFTDPDGLLFRPKDSATLANLAHNAKAALWLLDFTANVSQNNEWRMHAAILDEFDVFVPLEVLRDANKRLDVLKMHVNATAVSRAQKTNSVISMVVSNEELALWAVPSSQQQQQQQASSVDNGRRRKGLGAANFTNTRRLADILGIETTNMYGFVAEAAARTGDIETALLLCRELSTIEGAELAGEFIKRVAFYLSDEALPEMLDTDSVLSQRVIQLPDAILRLGRHSVKLARVDELPECLDNYKRFELETTIFHQCDAYDSMAHEENIKKNAKHKKNDGSASESDSMSTHFYESGLVLKTTTAMPLLEAYLKPEETSNGKGKANVEASPQTGMALGKYLLDNAAFQTALRAFKHAEERLLRPLLKQSASSASQHLVTYYRGILESLFAKVLTAREIDSELAFGYMVSLPMENAFNCFKASLSTIGRRFERLVVMTGVGLSCGILWKQRTFQLDMKGLAANARWWQLLTALDIPFEEARFRSNNHQQYARQFIAVLLKKTAMDLHTVLQFTRTYHLEDDVPLFEYIQMLLPLTNCSSSTSSSSLAVAHAEHDDVSPSACISYQDRIAGVIDDIDNKENLVKCITSEWLVNVSPTDYECFTFLYTLLIRVTQTMQPSSPNTSDIDEWKKCLVILDILQTYQSRNDNISSTQGSSSSHRLPFSDLVNDPWKILKLELNTDTVNRLLPLALPLNIAPDEFYIAAIKQSNNQSNFSTLKPLLLKIRDTQLAMETAESLATLWSPYHSDHLAALKLALLLAERWQAQTLGLNAKTNEAVAILAEAATNAVDKLKVVVANTETQAQLKEYKLERFYEFISQPIECVCQLYDQLADKQPSTRPQTNQGFDLHTVAADISNRHGVDVTKVRTYLLNKWLRSPRQEETTFVSLPSATLKVDGYAAGGPEAILQRKIIFTLRALPIDRIVAYLLNLAYQEISQKVSLLSKVRSLSVLFKTATPEQITEAAPVEQVREYMKTLLYLCDFEECNIPQTAKEFDRSDKDGLARSLWRSYSNEPKVLLLIANLMIDYRLTDPTIWTNVLQGLMKANLTHELLSYLVLLSSHIQLSMQIPLLSEMWQTSLTAVAPSVITAADASIKAEDCHWHPLIVAIEQCPCLSRLSISPLIQLALSKNAALIALSLARIIADGLDGLPVESLAQMERLLDEPTLQRALQLFSFTHSPTNCHVLSPVERWMFELVDKRRAYSYLIKAPAALDAFIRWIVEHDRIQGLLKAIVAANLRKQGEELSLLYLRRWHTEKVQQDAVPDRKSFVHLQLVLEIFHMSDLMTFN